MDTIVIRTNQAHSTPYLFSLLRSIFPECRVRIVRDHTGTGAEPVFLSQSIHENLLERKSG